jgi:hypothetical protein
LSDFFVFGPTYNRPKLLARICRQLMDAAKATGLTVHHYVLNDSSTEKYMPDYMKLLKTLEQPDSLYSFEMAVTKDNNGRDNYWQTYNDLLSRAKIQDFDYGVFIHDDMVLCSNFLARVKDSLDHVRKQETSVMAMNLLSLSPIRWGTPRWLDRAYVADKRFFGRLGFTVHPVQPQIFQANPKADPKVSEQIVARCGVMPRPTIAMSPPISFVKPMETPSVMFHPDKFPDRPSWVEVPNFLDGSETAGEAS